MKVHLIFAPTRFHLNYGDLGKGIDPPLGILYLASYSRKYGPPDIEYKVTDGILDGYDKTLESVLAEKADVVGISAVTPNVLGAYKLINAIKEKFPETRVILGGPHPTAMPEEALERSKADVVVLGEGELTFLELLRFYSNPNSKPEEIKHIDGISFHSNDKIFLTPPRKFIQDLDLIPFPARDLLDMKKYSGYPLFKASPSTTILMSRGCPFKCTFCSNNVWRCSLPSFRVRSPKNIADELQELAAKWNFKEFFDNSDELNTNIKHTKEVLKEIISRKLGIFLKCQVRAKPMDEELARLMKEAGVWYLHLGIESGNEETLKGIRKKIKLAEVEQCCRILKKYGIKIWGLFMYFNMWEENGQVVSENYDQSMNTFNYAKILYNNKLIDYFGGSITTPVPGSELWEIAVRQNLIKKECLENWDMWFYKRDLRLVSRFPNVSEEAVFRLHQKTVQYTVRSLLLSNLLNFRNLPFTLRRGFYFLKRQVLITLRTHLFFKKSNG